MHEKYKNSQKDKKLYKLMEIGDRKRENKKL
jgi:hypothetical protein